MSHINSLCHFYCARKGSGKTYDIGNKVQELIDKNKITQAYIFSSTASLDPSWKRIIKSLKKADIEYEVFDGINDRDIDDRGREYKVNNLKTVLEELQPKKGGGTDKKQPEEEEYRFDPVRNVWIYKNCIILPANTFIPTKEGVKPKKEKPTPISPLFIFDDLSKRELRGVDLYNFIKKSRHFGQHGGTCYVYLSSQFPTDLAPDTWQNIDRLSVFKGFGDEYLKKIHNRTNISIPYDELLNKYKEMTQEQFSKMEIDMRNDKIIN